MWKQMLANRKLSALACRADRSRGRLHHETESRYRTPFQRDRDRILHSSAFRRLKRKTQVFVHPRGDHCRTRLTHSLEVSQIARTLARIFALDEDLAEALALSHDLGHPPFGHVGEDVLDEQMKSWGGFDHNAQALRVVTKLERHYPDFDGMNLSWETLEGLAKHNGPLSDPPASIVEFNERFDLELLNHSSLEAQCAAIADDIAYEAHDLDDGLRAGLLRLDDLSGLPLTGELLAEARDRHGGLDESRLACEVVRSQIGVMVDDVIDRSRERIEALAPESERDVRNADHALIGFGEEVAEQDKAIKAFLHEKLYCAEEMVRVRSNAADILRDLFEAYRSGKASPPEGFDGDLRGVCDFLAGMSDGYAVQIHQSLFDETPELI